MSQAAPILQVMTQTGSAVSVHAYNAFEGNHEQMKDIDLIAAQGAELRTERLPRVSRGQHAIKCMYARCGHGPVMPVGGRMRSLPAEDMSSSAPAL